MRTRTLPPNSAVALHGIWAILVLAFVVVALYFGRTVFVPIALAALITFLLSRLVSRLEKWIGRVPSVLLCVVVAFTILGAVGWIVGRQVVDLAGNLPQYQANITRKVRSLRIPAAGSLARITSSVDALQKEVINASPDTFTERPNHRVAIGQQRMSRQFRSKSSKAEMPFLSSFRKVLRRRSVQLARPRSCSSLLFSCC